MSPYPSYKESGVEWIGEIPSGWEIRRIWSLGKFSKGRGIKKDEVKQNGIPCIRYGEIYTDYNRVVYSPKSFIDEETSQNSEPIKKGDVLFTGSGETLEEIGKSIVYFGDYPVFVGGDIIILRLNDDLDPLFSSFMMNSHYVNSKKTQSGRGGIIVHIYPKQLKGIRVTLPPLQEQQQISNYLDHKTQEIDSLIVKTQLKIELLKEQRISLINQVVTKGLNPVVEMKDSGVEWIGEIPIHFDLVKLKYLCSVKTGNKDTQDRVEDGEYPFYVRSPIIERINSYSFEGESVLTVGDGVGTGKVFHYVNGKFEYHQRVYKFSDFSKITGKFFYWFMKHHFIFVTEDQNSKSTVDSLRRPLIDGFQFVLPPLQEQQQIIDHLDKETTKIDFTIEKETQRIELLKEYRQSLISEVVTGKVDVRDEVLV